MNRVGNLQPQRPSVTNDHIFEIAKLTYQRGKNFRGCGARTPKHVCSADASRGLKSDVVYVYHCVFCV